MCFRFIHMRFPIFRAWNKFREIAVVTDSHRRLQGGAQEVDVVSSLVHSSMWQYAVISVRSEPHCDRLVIAYPDEKSLRDLLAAPSILGLGYHSREEAEASADRYTMTAYPSQRKVMAIANHQHPRFWFKLTRTWSIIRDVLQHSFGSLSLASIQKMRRPQRFRFHLEYGFRS